MYGIKFKELNNADTWHEEVKCYEITNDDDSLVGLIYIDLHPRPTKRSGAWMSSIKDNGLYNGKLLPSNDYWFNIELTDRSGKKISRKGHFSLLRK